MGSSKWLVAHGTKPLPEPVWMRACGIHLSSNSNSQEMFKLSSTKMSLKITHFRLSAHFPAANELMNAYKYHGSAVLDQSDRVIPIQIRWPFYLFLNRWTYHISTVTQECIYMDQRKSYNIFQFHNSFQWVLKPCKPQYPGPRLNIKTVLSTYGDFHVKDKTAVRTSYL